MCQAGVPFGPGGAHALHGGRYAGSLPCADPGPTEAVNLLIAKIRRLGHGYRNFANHSRRLLLGCGVQWDTVLTRRIRGRQPAFVA